MPVRSEGCPSSPDRFTEDRRQPTGAGDPPALPRHPAWKRPFCAVRVVVALLVALVVALFMEFWMRIRVIPWHDETDPIWPLLWNRLIRGWGVTTFASTCFLLGLKVVVEGEIPSSGRYVIVANHQSSLDTPAFIWLFRKLNLKFVANDGLKYGKPAVSLALRRGGFAIVAKKNRDEDLAALRRFARELEWYDSSAVVFPEGRRTYDGAMLPFHFAGTETVRRVARLPVVPVTHDGLWRAKSIAELMNIVGSTLRFRVHEVVPFEEIERNPWGEFSRLEERIRRNLLEMRRTD